MKKNQNIEITGYDFNINLSQIGAMNAGLLPGDISLDELAIMDSFKNYTTWANNAEKRIYHNVIYYHYPWKMIIKRIPYLKAQGQTAIKAKLNNLANMHMLRPHPNNQMLAKSFYAFGKKYVDFVNVKPYRKTDKGTNQNADPIGKPTSTLSENRQAPYRKTDKHPIGKPITIDNSKITEIKESIFLKKDFQSFKNFAPTWNAWKEYLTKKRKPIQDKEMEENAFQHLINVSEGNLANAKKIITQAKAGGYTNLVPLVGSQKKYSPSDFPNEWDSNFFSKLKPDQISKYYKHLRELGFTPVKHNGQTIKWSRTIPQPTP